MRHKNKIQLIGLLLLYACSDAPQFNRISERDLQGQVANTKLHTLCPADARGYLKNLNWCYQIHWQQDISTIGDNRFTINFTPLDDELTDKFDFHAYLWMPEPHMNHGSAPLRIQKTSATSYQVSNVFFIMAGLWELRLQFKDKGQTIDQDILTIHL